MANSTSSVRSLLHARQFFLCVPKIYQTYAFVHTFLSIAYPFLYLLSILIWKDRKITKAYPASNLTQQLFCLSMFST